MEKKEKIKEKEPIKVTAEQKAKILKAVLARPYEFEIMDDETGKGRKLTLKPPCLNCIFAVSELFAETDLKDLERNDIHILELVKKYGVKLLKALTMLINNSDKVDEDLYMFLKKNLDSGEQYELFTEAMLRIGIADFHKSIIVAQAMSLMNDREIIARLSTLGN